MKKASREIGAAFEEKAAMYLKEKGYHILDRNYISPFGEIDLIAKKDGYLIFAEVKYRITDRSGHPLEVVDDRKKKRICKTAAFYCMKKRVSAETPMRFDVIGILEEEIYHIEHAFEYR